MTPAGSQFAHNMFCRLLLSVVSVMRVTPKSKLDQGAGVLGPRGTGTSVELDEGIVDEASKGASLEEGADVPDVKWGTTVN